MVDHCAFLTSGQQQPASYSSSALIEVSIASFLLTVTVTIIIIIQCLLMARMRKSKDVHRNETNAEVINPTTMPVTPHEACALNRMNREDDIYSILN